MYVPPPSECLKSQFIINAYLQIKSPHKEDKILPELLYFDKRFDSTTLQKKY